MQDWRRALSEAVAGCAAEVRFAEPLAQHTTFRIGGLADAWVCVRDRQALSRVLEACRVAEVRTWFLGRGSNVLVSDQGLRGVVINLGGELSAVRVEAAVLRAGAGAMLDDVVAAAEQAGLVGVDFLAGIPGTVGGGLHTNAGAFGRSLGDVVTSVAVMDRNGKERELTGSELRREYRQPMVEDGLVATEVTMQLQDRIQGLKDSRGPVPDTGILDSSTPGFLSADEIRRQRWARHPKEPSAGSFFRNPQTADGGRVPAGRLIDQCGLKGKAIRGAKVSEHHANFLVNTGRARFVDVYELAQVVKATVEQETGILLEEEVQYLPGPNEGRSQKPEGRTQNSRVGVANGGR